MEMKRYQISYWISSILKIKKWSLKECLLYFSLKLMLLFGVYSQRDRLDSVKYMSYVCVFALLPVPEFKRFKLILFWKETVSLI